MDWKCWYFKSNDGTFEHVDKASQTLNEKHTGYKKLANLSKEEIEKMFFGVNDVDPKYYRITRIAEIDEPQVKIQEGTYNSQINRVRMSQIQENDGKKPKETEKWLWHITNVQPVDKIVANGFDRNRNTMSAYGRVKIFFHIYIYTAVICCPFLLNNGTE